MASNWDTALELTVSVDPVDVKKVVDAYERVNGEQPTLEWVKSFLALDMATYIENAFDSSLEDHIRDLQ